MCVSTALCQCAFLSTLCVIIICMMWHRHGFQYVLVTSNGTGFAGGLNDIVGLEIHTNVTATGSLTFGGPSSDVLNGIQSMTLASQVTNVAAYMPTDCPTREKYEGLFVLAISDSSLCGGLQKVLF